MESTIYSIIPPLLAIIMVIVTRRVLLSLGIGIITSALLLAQFNVVDTGLIIGDAMKGLVIDDGSLDTWNLFIILFLLILGVLTAFIQISGGSRAFGDWAIKRVKTRVGAQVLTILFGMLIFIDDYFNSLAVGQVSRPITDRHRISRAKLAYLIDSTSAPVCVVSPVSSWGAYIIGIIGTIFTAHGITEYTPFMAFLKMIPMNIYAWITLAFVFIVALKRIDIGSMKDHEKRAIETGETFNPDKKIPGELKDHLPVSEKGRATYLIWPILILIIATVLLMFLTGYRASSGNVHLLDILNNTDVAKSLFYGGMISLATIFFFFFKQKDVFKVNIFIAGLKEGIKSMISAVLILLFAWMIADLIDQLQTGTYLAGLVEKANISTSFLPVLLFIIAGLMAFSTGTSWGSFGILLPIAGEIAVVTDLSLLLPSMAAVLAGAVFGDHCSPISDTTILSSTGAGSNHIDHVMTQLPYALLVALITSIGYILLGVTGNTWFALMISFIILFLITFVLQRRGSTENK